MAKARMICAVLLALPLLVFGANYFVPFLDVPPPPDHAGGKLLTDMRAGGLMAPIAASHVLIGAMLLVPRFRFLAGLLQLPLAIGIVAFHFTMMREGTAIAVGMLALNAIVVADGAKWRALLGSGVSAAGS